MGEELPVGPQDLSTFPPSTDSLFTTDGLGLEDINSVFDDNLDPNTSYVPITELGLKQANQHGNSHGWQTPWIPQN